MRVRVRGPRPGCASRHAEALLAFRSLLGCSLPFPSQVRHGPEFYRAALRWETPEQVAAAREGGRHRLEALYNRVTPVRHDPQPRPTQPQPQELSGTGEGLTARVVLDGSDQGLAAGQYAVFYDRHGHCLGCAVILGQEGWSSEETAAL